jgi:hypothetical protein
MSACGERVWYVKGRRAQGKAREVFKKRKEPMKTKLRTSRFLCDSAVPTSDLAPGVRFSAAWDRHSAHFLFFLDPYLKAMPHRASSTTLPLLPLYDPRVLAVHHDISPDPLRHTAGHMQASLCDRPCPPLLSPKPYSPPSLPPPHTQHTLAPVLPSLDVNPTTAMAVIGRNA